MSAGFDELMDGVDMRPLRKVVIKPNGDEFVFWATPLTLEERERARKEAKKDDASDFAITLLVQKALNNDGRRRFTNEDLTPMRRTCPAALAESILEKLLNDEEDAIETVDMEVSTNGSAVTPKKSETGSLTKTGS
jgi:hypothetical protein